MKAVFKLGVVVLLASSLLAQTKTAAKKKPSKPVNPDVQALKEAVAAQQAQIQALQQQLQQTNQQLQQTSQQFQTTQQQLQQAQQTAADAQQKAAAVESTAVHKESVDQLNSKLADVQTTLTNNALSTQDQQKRFSGIEDALGRLRWTGDVRVRGEDFFQGYGGCTNCNDRNRARIRIRFGFEGKLNDDFTGGIALATGSLGDPTTTNETFANFFDRKTIGLDKGYITYNPVAHKWLSLTGGKFVYQWQRTQITGDPDTNPEGFNEKFSKDFTSPIVKNLNVDFMQLFFNEVSGNGGLFVGRDSFAVGGQVGGKLELTKFWTMTPSFLLLNWRYPDAILNGSFFATQATTTNSTSVVTSTGSVVSFPVPGEGPGCSTPASSGLQSSQACAFSANGMTNATFVDASGKLHFLSRFLYADLILNNQFKTGWARLPINLLLEYENNLNASEHPFDFTFTNTSTVKGDTFANPFAAQAAARADLGKQSHVYYADISIGQQKKRGDIQAGYAFLRHEQDATIASFNESDQRAPSNILQHRVYALWRIRQNATAAFTWWHGRTLDPLLQNATLAPGMKVSATPGTGVIVPGSGTQEPWLNRLQFDLIYTF